jgi:hypothetical protein
MEAMPQLAVAEVARLALVRRVVGGVVAWHTSVASDSIFVGQLATVLQPDLTSRCGPSRQLTQE